ncbi:MAG TPA: BatA domain-containing protein, partial [Vicinamibacterales bacterium]|nr:BatA domain-containing protein [Vicinamibacterales bacterium]
MTLEWLNPAAFAGLAAVAGPLIVHLLLRPRAVRVQFPSVRFIAGSSTAAVRPRRPSDGLLLLLRATIVGAAVTALAAPVFVTSWKRSMWDARLSRAVVVDASGSMADAAARASQTAAAEREGATYRVAIEAQALRDGVSRAVTALRDTPPARRELVIVSDLHAGALTAGDLEVV